ncbi:hypothetical protein J3Q64DRAFT_1719100 [Phycomyces blakesleeanus]|uniref:1,3-beta-glucanosyltransferase n=1 Tax=Phycomyces blakesleeanus TaxID=4837 RepID=A0ABR3B8T4_PHYBL
MFYFFIGGQALAPETTTFSNSADFLKAIANVDVIIDETYIATNLTDILENYQIPQSDVSKYKFLTNQAVFREDGILTQTGGFDWFEAPVVMADALLEDIIHAVNPSAPTADYKHNWIRNVAKAETISYIDSASCTWEENEKRPNMAVTFTGGQFAQPSYVSTSTTTTSGASTSSISSSLKIGSLGATIIAVSLMFM